MKAMTCVWKLSFCLLVAVELSGCNNEDKGLLDSELLPSPIEVVETSALVSIAGNSADGQAFPAGVPVQLTFSVDFTNGFTYSTDSNTNDSD
ncbi:hypothetical protein, partial [Vibrio hyugaensis]|uniref:hypothetical protein n=1 Tax=Vibrio hyugaensis TaxID=1534743 RepID=UPI0005EFA958